MSKLTGFVIAIVLVSGVIGLPALARHSATRIEAPQTPRQKRKPYDPVKQPPEGDSSEVKASEKYGMYSSCWPKDVNPDSRNLDSLTSSTSAQPTTVKQRLTQLKARCVKGKLRDGRGKQIYLYPMVGCWGNPPEGYQEILARQETELKRLEQKFTVIRVSCLQSTDPRLVQ